MSGDFPATLAKLEGILGHSWTNIRSAYARTVELRRQLHGAVSSLAPVDTSIVVFGSIARGEATEKSDVDWTLLIDGQAYAAHLNSVQQIEEKIVQLKLKEPGREGTFGGMAFSHELVHHIGGGDDSNANLTRRILLLLESRAVGPADPHSRVVRQLVKRYVEEDFGWVYGRNPKNVPRFLQNDIARYWRTVAVDFAYKRRSRQNRGWALRTVKLRLSRKLTYVAGLLACYSCSEIAAGGFEKADERTLALVDHLTDYLQQSPLEIVAGTVLAHMERPVYQKAAADIFQTYDRFLGMLDNGHERSTLEELSPQDAANSTLYESARSLGHQFQDALTAIFLEDRESALYQFTRTYGVF